MVWNFDSHKARQYSGQNCTVFHLLLIYRRLQSGSCPFSNTLSQLTGIIAAVALKSQCTVMVCIFKALVSIFMKLPQNIQSL